MPLDTRRESKTSKKGSRVRGDGNAEGETPREDRYHHKRPPGASPAPAGGGAETKANSKRVNTWTDQEEVVITKS